MTNLLSLRASLRTDLGSRSAEALRRAGSLPGVVYSGGQAPLNVIVDTRDFVKIYHQSGDSTIITLSLDQAGDQPVLIHDVSSHPLTGQLLHIDFYRVDMTKTLETTVPLMFTGIAPAVKSYGAYIEYVLRELDIECLPAHLPQHIDVDISSLAHEGDILRVADIRVPDGVVIVTDADQVVALAEMPAEEESALPVGADAEAAAIQAVGSSKEKDNKEDDSTSGSEETPGNG